MGSNLWIDSKGEMTGHGGKVSRTEDIDLACEQFLETFGTMTWRIDRKDNELIERTCW